MKHSGLYGSIAILGIAILAAAITIVYQAWGGYGISLNALPPYLLSFFIICGTVFLIAGILGIGRQYFKNHKNLFTVLTIILVPILVFAVILLVLASLPPLRV